MSRTAHYPILIATLATGLLAGCAADPSPSQPGSPPQTAKAEPADRGLMCIPVRGMRNTTVIDDRTILVEMQDRTKFTRIDLANRCIGLGTYGFGYVSHNDELCRTDPLTLVGLPVPPVCLIDSMIPIDKAAADALKAQRDAKKRGDAAPAAQGAVD
ncbi:DUF6491 family protein [Nitrospirillum iridis]|uniref:Lipoprotein n=1 Tax=Nitrospirillum iridis TaxID=765888 RepID=A0A7X0EAW2_9PROT|nr:DUF6491 family protein [Nitrospirillum iridis]MBB6249540.1 hypothetical protein [Nitrospirillum iridis]